MTPFDITGMASWWRRPLMEGRDITPWPMGHPEYEGKLVRLVDGVPMLMDRVKA